MKKKQTTNPVCRRVAEVLEMTPNDVHDILVLAGNVAAEMVAETLEVKIPGVCHVRLREKRKRSPGGEIATYFVLLSRMAEVFDQGAAQAIREMLPGSIVRMR